MSILLTVFGIFAGTALYKRYIPVKGTPCLDGLESCNRDENMVLLDVRDFQESSADPVEGSLNIPLAYLKRYSSDIPNKRVVLIADSFILANMATRFLRLRKFNVAGVHFKGMPKTDKKRSCCQWQDIALTPKKQIN
ncbi:rhodanese-like domain-containing protein [Bacillus marinisedimentorum]|uniref:rhodanese-like domain-containing protein n=1 Tax=Bacillus marinisedimentorum TaxID=1821260 RepID=UPI0008726CE5|nr:rhodanese-like domain-containing protein [Bacillus marinisedimentorum]